MPSRMGPGNVRKEPPTLARLSRTTPGGEEETDEVPWGEMSMQGSAMFGEVVEDEMPNWIKDFDDRSGLRGWTNHQKIKGLHMNV